MKKAFKSVIPAMVFLLSPALSYGEFSLPDYVYTMDDLDAAKVDADTYQQPISFVYSNEYTDCGLATSATLDAFSELVKTTIVVYASSNKEDSDWDNIPTVVKRAIKSSKAGKYIPKTVIVDENMSRVVAIVPYVRSPYKRMRLLNKINGEIEENYE